MSDLPRIVGATQPGTKAKMKVWRKGKSETLTVTVAELETGDGKAKTPKAPKEQTSDRLGLSVATLDDEDKAHLGIDEGVVVESASGPAARVGVSSGDRKSTRLNSSHVAISYAVF